MPNLRIYKGNTSLPHFLTLTVIRWYYLFDRHNRWNILSQALEYQIKNHQLQVYAFIFMLNHLHLIVSAPDLISCLRDFKKYTTHQMKLSIASNESHVLTIMTDEEGKFQLWQNSNMPIVLESETVLNQKIQYIHNNPVKKQYVNSPEYWYWSSANPDCPITLAPI